MQIATHRKLAMTDGTAFQTSLHSNDKRKAKPDRHANEIRNGTLLPYWKVKQ